MVWVSLTTIQSLLSSLCGYSVICCSVDVGIISGMSISHRLTSLVGESRYLRLLPPG